MTKSVACDIVTPVASNAIIVVASRVVVVVEVVSKLVEPGSLLFESLIRFMNHFCGSNGQGSLLGTLTL